MIKVLGMTPALSGQVIGTFAVAGDALYAAASALVERARAKSTTAAGPGGS